MNYPNAKRFFMFVCIVILSTLLVIALDFGMRLGVNAIEKANPTSDNHTNIDSLKCNEPYVDIDYGLHCVKIDITDPFQKDPSTVVGTTEGNDITITVGITAVSADEGVDFYLWDKTQSKYLMALDIVLYGTNACTLHLGCAMVISDTHTVSLTQLNETPSDTGGVNGGKVYVELTFTTKAKKPTGTDTQTYSGKLCRNLATNDVCYLPPGWVIADRSLQIYPRSLINLTYLSTHSFIASDPITLKAQLSDATPNTAVEWTVIGLDAAKDIPGFPTKEKSVTDNSGISTFTFKPSANQNLVNDRRSRWATGSKIANLPLSFDVIVKVTIDGKETEARLSTSAVGPLKQDEIDIAREEYYDYQINSIPDRKEFIPSLGRGYNAGNYNVQMSDELPELYQKVLAAYHGKQVATEINISGKPIRVSVAIPNYAQVIISSGYRSPQHNNSSEVRSKHPKTSKHIFGKALDLIPRAVETLVEIPINGQLVTQRVILDPHKVLYPALQQAGAAVSSYSICEQSTGIVTCGVKSEDHVHVQR